MGRTNVTIKALRFYRCIQLGQRKRRHLCIGHWGARAKMKGLRNKFWRTAFDC